MQTLTTAITLEFAADETQLVADVLALIAAARTGVVVDDCCRTRPEPGEDKEPVPEKPIRVRRSNDVTHNDIRDLMAELIETDDNRPKVLKAMHEIGAKSVGTIKDEHVADFYDFLRSLKTS